jgi:hypothetical protein
MDYRPKRSWHSMLGKIAFSVVRGIIASAAITLRKSYTLAPSSQKSLRRMKLRLHSKGF